MSDSPNLQAINAALSGLGARLEQASPHQLGNVGVDHLPIARVGEHVPVDTLLGRITTVQEHRTWFSDCEPPLRRRRAAQVFCLKEACAKAMGLGFGAELSWSNLEVQSLETGSIARVRFAGRGDWELLAGSDVVADMAIALAAAHR